MRIRWLIATLASLGLAALVVGSFVHVRTPPITSCGADARPANLSFTLKDVAGRDVTLSTFRGKVILLDFWATWCEPCKVEIPAFVNFQTQYGKDGLQVVGISVDDTPAQLEPYIAKMQMNYPVLQGKDHDEVQQAFGATVVYPVTVVIARDGRICAVHAGFASKEVFEQEIKALL